MVARAVPSCWEVVAPEALCTVRARAAATALGELCRVEARTGLAAVLPLLRHAVAGCDAPGRVMAAANQDLWPVVAADLGPDGLAEAWQACTTLREHRGDGHVAALVTRGLSGLEAHLLAAGTKGIPSEILRDNRGWSAAEWDAGTAALVDLGLLHRRRAGHRRGAHVARRGRGPHRRVGRTGLRGAGRRRTRGPPRRVAGLRPGHRRRRRAALPQPHGPATPLVRSGEGAAIPARVRALGTAGATRPSARRGRPRRARRPATPPPHPPPRAARARARLP